MVLDPGPPLRSGRDDGFGNMRTVTPALAAYLAGLQAQLDAPALMADCFTFTLATGAVLTYTNADVPIVLNGATFLANALLVDGLQYKCATGLDVDKQKITISARPTDTIGGIPFLQAIRNGLLDGCEVQRDRAFLSSWSAPPIGGVTLFKGRVATVDSVGRTTAQITVASDLVLLDIPMPRNLYQPACNHVLFDSGCGLVKNAWSAAGIVGADATAVTVPWSAASAAYAQGTLFFTSGANTGVKANIKDATASALVLSYPLPNVPAQGDAFTATQGCDHTLATCKAKFNNAARFRGFPFVPAPDTML